MSGWLQEERDQSYHLASLPPPPSPARPWEGLVKIVLASLSSILTGSLASTVAQSHLLIINIYIFFILSGTTDLLVFYCGYSLLPEGLQSFILAASFAVESISYQALLTSASPASSQALQLLVLVSSSCCLVAALETVLEHRLVKFCRCYFTALQASWLLQLTSLSTWVAIIFSCHAAGLFTISISVLMMAQVCCKSSQPPHTRLRSVQTKILSGKYFSKVRSIYF